VPCVFVSFVFLLVKDSCSTTVLFGCSVLVCPLQDVKNIDTNSKEKIGFLNFIIVIVALFLSVFFSLSQGCTLSPMVAANVRGYAQCGIKKH
jgi:hypothetical protein